METQDQREARLEARLKEIYAELPNQLDWSRGVDLVLEGIQVISQYGRQINDNPELKEIGKYIMGEALFGYYDGPRADYYSRQMILNAQNNASPEERKRIFDTQSELLQE